MMNNTFQLKITKSVKYYLHSDFTFVLSNAGTNLISVQDLMDDKKNESLNSMYICRMWVVLCV